MHLAILATVGGIVLVFRALQFLNLTTQADWGFDFAAYWLAGSRIAEGQSPYSIEQLAGAFEPGKQFVYLYPPMLAALVSPLSMAFDAYRDAMRVWAAIGAVVLVVSVAAVARAERLDRIFTDRLPIPRTAAIAVFVGAAFAMPPIIGELTVGNVHLELLGLFALAWLGIRTGSVRGQRIAGVAIGIAALIKVFPGLLVLWFLLTGRRTAAAWAVGGAAIVAAALLPVTGLQPWLDYPRVLANMGAVGISFDSVSPTLWLEPLVGFTIARAIVTVIGLALVVYAARSRPSALGFGIAVAASTLIAPAVFHHYLAVLVIPLLLALSSGVHRGVLLVAYLLLWGGQQLSLGDWAWVLSRVPQTIGWALLLGAMVVARPRPAPDDTSADDATPDEVAPASVPAGVAT